MPGRVHTFSLATTTDVPESAANTETVAATLNGVLSEFPGQQILVQGYVTITAGTTATSMTLRIRRGSLTGTLISEANIESGDIVASKETTLPVWAQDSPGEVAGLAYVVTFQGAGEGTAANCAGSLLQATVS